MAALAAVAGASSLTKESTENYATRCVWSGQQYNTRSYTSCRSYVKQWRCCTKWVYKWQGLAHCNQLGGHLCAYSSRQCGGRKGYYFKNRRICKKAALNWKRAPGAAWNIAHNWTKIPGSAIRAAVNKYGKGWVVNKNAYIYYHNG